LQRLGERGVGEARAKLCGGEARKKDTRVWCAQNRGNSGGVKFQRVKLPGQ
jgi:hypothetical protein